MTQHAVVGGRWRDHHSKFVVEERYLPRATRARLYFVSATMVAVGLTAFIVLLLGALTHSGFELLDEPLGQWFDAQRNAGATGFMIVVAIVFGPIGMPIIANAAQSRSFTKCRSRAYPSRRFGWRYAGSDRSVARRLFR